MSSWIRICSECGGEVVGQAGCYACSTEATARRGGQPEQGHHLCSVWSEAQASSEKWYPLFTERSDRACDCPARNLR